MHRFPASLLPDTLDFQCDIAVAPLRSLLLRPPPRWARSVARALRDPTDGVRASEFITQRCVHGLPQASAEPNVTSPAGRLNVLPQTQASVPRLKTSSCTAGIPNYVESAQEKPYLKLDPSHRIRQNEIETRSVEFDFSKCEVCAYRDDVSPWRRPGTLACRGWQGSLGKMSPEEETTSARHSCPGRQRDNSRHFYGATFHGKRE